MESSTFDGAFLFTEASGMPSIIFSLFLAKLFFWKSTHGVSIPPLKSSLLLMTGQKAFRRISKQNFKP